MFIRSDANKSIQYIVSGNILNKIVFDQEWSLNLLNFYGKFHNCDKLKKFHQGVLGEIQVDSTSIRISTKRVASDQLSALFNAMEEEVPEFKNIKVELLTLIYSESAASKNKTNNTRISQKSENDAWKHLHISRNDLEKDCAEIRYKKRVEEDKKNPEQSEDLKKMYARLLGFEGFDNIEAKTILGNSCRTVDAHYQHPDFRIHDSEDVLRTTITAPEFGIAYIEYRTTPEVNYGDSYAIVDPTYKWLIAFKTAEDAKKYCKLIPVFYKYSPGLFEKVTSSTSNLFYINRQSIDDVLSQLVEAGCCPKEAIDQQNQIKKRASFNI